MDELIVILFPTFNRTEYAVRTIRAARQNLKYPNLAWYLADSGSTQEHHDICVTELDGANIFGSHYQTTSPGRSWNMASDKIFEKSNFLFRLEDDFELNRELNIEKYVKALVERVDWGLVRLGGLPVGLDCKTVGHDGVHYLWMLRSAQYAYSGNPLIMHKRFWERYRYYDENQNPGNCEIKYDELFRSSPGSEIVWPVEIGGWGCFGHIGERQSY
jgi:glycosyltransferase involved in cell wall biosynthesis